jgi:thiamine-phosphate pyrophosphorylase
LEQVRRLISGGATIMQLREKNAPAGEFYLAAVEAVSFAHAHGARIIINDRVDIALASNADGVHLGQDDLPPKKARELLGSSAIIGFSTHSVEQARQALTLPIDYFAIGPIFDTSTKENPDPIVGLDGLTRIRELAPNLPIVAIGGIDRKNARSVLSAGADSVALISDVVSEPAQIADRMEELLRV